MLCNTCGFPLTDCFCGGGEEASAIDNFYYLPEVKELRYKNYHLGKETY